MQSEAVVFQWCCGEDGSTWKKRERKEAGFSPVLCRQLIQLSEIFLGRSESQWRIK